MNQTYYELLRLYSNELRKREHRPICDGFSFADEHIREITIASRKFKSHVDDFMCLPTTQRLS